MTHAFICTPPGTATRNATLPAGVQPECRNGTGQWVDLNQRTDARVIAYFASNPQVIDDRIAAYLEANPGGSSGGGTVILQPAEMGAAWGAGFVAAATGLVMIWAARSVLDAISVATR